MFDPLTVSSTSTMSKAYSGSLESLARVWGWRKVSKTWLHCIVLSLSAKDSLKRLCTARSRGVISSFSSDFKIHTTLSTETLGSSRLTKR